jgi:hypothetical protein
MGGNGSADTDAAGRFAFGSVSSEVDLFLARPGDRYRFVLRHALQLSPGERRQLQLVLPDPRPSVQVSVTDARDVALEGAQVSLMSLSPSFPLRQTAYTGEAGEVGFSDAAGLNASVRVAAAGFRDFELELESLPPSLSLALERGVRVVGRVTHVRGRQGLAGARVVLTQRGRRQEAISDAFGAFELKDASAGPGRLSISHADLSGHVGQVQIETTGHADRPFELAPIDLQEAGSVSGVVIDANGEPVADARVGVGVVPAFLPVGPVPDGLAQTRADGTFTLLKLGVGPVTLSAYAAEVGRGSVQVEVQPGDLTDPVVLTLSELSEPAAGASLANVAITLGETSPAGGPLVTVLDVAEGSEAERAGVRAGDVVVAVDGAEPHDMADARERLGGADGSDVVVDLLRDGTPLSVLVRRQAVRR